MLRAAPIIGPQPEMTIGFVRLKLYRDFSAVDALAEKGVPLGIVRRVLTEIIVRARQLPGGLIAPVISSSSLAQQRYCLPDLWKLLAFIVEGLSLGKVCSSLLFVTFIYGRKAI